MKIVVLTNNNSVFGKKILNALINENVSINSIVIINQPLSYSYKLFKSVKKRIGLFNAIYLGLRRLLFEKSQYKMLLNNNEIETDYNKLSNNIILTKGINSIETINVVRSLKADIIVLGQTGIIKKDIIESAKYILNAHPGILPKYRGVDVHKWALINEEFNKIGCTIHLVDKGVDTGKIISVSQNNSSRFNNIYELIDLLHESCALNMATIVKKIISNTFTLEKQSKEDGKQFYKMPFNIEKQIPQKLKNYKEYLKNMNH